MKPERKAMIDALIKHKGNVTRAADEIDMNRENHYYWCHNDPEYKKAVDKVQDVALDFAEGKLFDGMDEMNMTAVIFYLKTRGKGRGYIERTEITGAGGGPVSHIDPSKLSKDALREILDNYDNAGE